MMFLNTRVHRTSSAQCGWSSARSRRECFLGRSDNMVKLRGINIFPQAIGAMFTLAREIHGALDRAAAAGAAAPAESLQKAVRSLRDRAEVLTFLTHPPRQWFQQAYAPEDAAGADGPLDDETIGRLVRGREEARARKDWAEADRIRDELKTHDVILEDSGAGTGWKRAQR